MERGVGSGGRENPGCVCEEGGGGGRGLGGYRFNQWDTLTIVGWKGVWRGLFCLLFCWLVA